MNFVQNFISFFEFGRTIAPIHSPKSTPDSNPSFIFFKVPPNCASLCFTSFNNYEFFFLFCHHFDTQELNKHGLIRI